MMMNSEMINIVNLIIIIYALIVCTDSLKESKFDLTDLCISVITILACIVILKLDFDICFIYIPIYLFFCFVLLFFTKKHVKPKKMKKIKKLMKKLKKLMKKLKTKSNKQKKNKDAHEEVKNIINLIINFAIIINKLILIAGIIALTYKIITLISSKSNLSADIVTLITVIVAFLTAVYTTMKSNKSDLSAESLWRKELMNVASKKEIGIDDLLRLRASQNYKYANKPNGDDKPEKPYINTGYKVRDKIGKATNDLYNKYIFPKSETVEISFEDQNAIRNLSIALLKYDYIKRGDNVKLTHYIIRELEEDNEYQNLLNWINKEVANCNSKLNT